MVGEEGRQRRQMEQQLKPSQWSEESQTSFLLDTRHRTTAVLDMLVQACPSRTICSRVWSIYVYAYVYKHISVCVCVYVDLCIYIRICIYICVYIYTYTYAYTHVCVHIYVFIHILICINI